MTTTDAERDDQLLLLASATEAAVQDTDRWHPEFPYVNLLHANLKYADLGYSTIQDDIPTTSPTSV